MTEHTFYLKVTVRTDEDNPEPQPDDFADFLNSRFTVAPDATYGLDAYNKDAPQLVTSVTVAPYPEPELIPEPPPASAACPDCHHPWANHDRLLEGAGRIMLPEYNPYQVEDLYECDAYAGMGEWCGCRSRSRLEYRPEGPAGYPVPVKEKDTP